MFPVILCARIEKVRFESRVGVLPNSQFKEKAKA